MSNFSPSNTRFIHYLIAVVLVGIIWPCGLFADKSLDIAETVLIYQRTNGGWPKNYDRKNKLSKKQRDSVTEKKDRIEDATIDNGATHREIRLLAEAFLKTKDSRYSEAASRGIDYLLRAQYDTGGWPQYYPKTKGYYRHITFNDGAMIGVMSLLREIANGHKDFSFVSDEQRRKCQTAIELGLDCILKCQIKRDGKRTVWCAQHDAKTLEPRPARTYELATFSGSESVGIVRYLMEIKNPSPQIIDAVESAVAWFKASRLDGIRVEKFQTNDGKSDRRVVADADAVPLWARFYDLRTNEPIFCSRDGIPRKSLNDISHERRKGYSWLGEYPAKLLAREYPVWKKSLTP